MNVSEFYKSKKCSINSEIERNVKSEVVKDRYLVLYDTVQKMCQMLKAGAGMTDILAMAKECIGTYEPEWFEFETDYTNALSDDLFLLERFLVWFFAQNYQVMGANITTHWQELTQTVNLLLKREDGSTEAMMLYIAKSNMGYNGTSNYSSIETRLEMMIPKLSLEPSYKGIAVS